MQKLPGARYRKRGDVCTERNLLAIERDPFFFSSDQQSDNTKIFLAAGRRPNTSVFRQHAV